MAAKADKPPSQRMIRMQQLEEENEQLRASLAIDGPVRFENWARSMPQEMRDLMAARALYSEWGIETNALKRLGFLIGQKSGENGYRGKELDELIVKVFQTEGVQRHLHESLADVDEQKQDLIRRQAHIAKYGDDEASARAFVAVAKVMGWIKPGETKISIDQRKVSLYQLANAGTTNRRSDEQVALETQPEAFLGHDPGEPARIDSGDEHIDALLLEEGE